MNFNIASVPRKLLWTAACIAVVALLTIIVVQLLTIILTTRPPILTRWLTGIFVIASQSIFASIALGISGYALQSTMGTTTVVSKAAHEVVPRASTPTLSTRPVEDEPRLPAALQSALAAANATPSKRKRGE